MFAGSNCDCLVCRLEKNLAGELGEPNVLAGSRALLASRALFSRFASPFDLLRELHGMEHRAHSVVADALLTELLATARSAHGSAGQRLLLLVFIPTVHRTTSQIAAVFPGLAREDVAQHVVSLFLEMLGSRELAARRSHLAFTIARKLRRAAFRWAIREARGAPPEEADSWAFAEEPVAEEPAYGKILLGEFLDNCQEKGLLSAEERGLLVAFKVEGATCQELAGRNGHRPLAVQHRLQRIVDRLRRLAVERQWQRPAEQLELFPRPAGFRPASTSKKIFH